jgi:putative DNA primase/helicase
MGGNAEMVAYLARVLGRCLSGDVSEQELYFFLGEGANGKSVFLDTLAGLMGDYACEAPPSLVTSRSHEEHPTELADLCGKRLVIASETEEGAKLRIQLVKRLTGNAVIKGRFMRQDYFEFPRTHKLILVTNNKPIIRETTNAVWRRVRLIPFTVTIPRDQQDPKLLEKLRAEWPGILAWAVRGCLDWQRNGMQTPDDVMVATEEYRVEQDPLREYLADRCILGEQAYVVRTEIYPDYQGWADKVGERHPMDRNTFYAHLRRVPNVSEGFKRIGGNITRIWQGIGLADLAKQYQQAQERLAM